MILGVLALQGDFDLHIEQLKKLNVESIKVKNRNELANTDALIIPGGESTTISLLIDKFNLRESLEKYCRERYVFGTCAGLIMISDFKDKKVKPLNIISVEIRRNAYGCQLDSFTKKIKLEFDDSSLFSASFIRAPKINKLNDSNIKVLAYDDNTPVLIRSGKLLGSSFHPEIGVDERVHKYFLKMISNG